MTKAELIKEVAAKSGITSAQAAIVVETLIKTVTTTVARGGKIRLVGIGTFSSATRFARTGRNPQTGQVIQIKSASVAKFSAGTAFKNRIIRAGGGTDDTGPMKTRTKR